MARYKKVEIDNPLSLRARAGQTQAQFWPRFGVNGANGSRYENGVAVPTPTAILIGLFELGMISDDDLIAARRAVGR